MSPPTERWSPETLRRFGVKALGGPAFLFPNGETYFADGRSRKVDAPEGVPRQLWPDPADVPGEVALLVEGRADVLSAAEMGLFNVVSVPSARKLRDDEAERIMRSRHRVYVVPDCDKPGRRAGRQWAEACAEFGPTLLGDLDPSGDSGFDLGDLLKLSRETGYNGRRFLEHRLDAAEHVFAPSVDRVEPDLAPASEVAAVLDNARVDLLELLDGGVPERLWVPGAVGLLPRGKRQLWHANAKVGKSLLALVLAVDVVQAGGRVAILDRENGADEYARRLADVMGARQRDRDDLPELLRGGLAYFAYPALKLQHGDGAAWAEFFASFDLIVFDSSRTFLSSLGLAEDHSDDYAQFMTRLIDPLSRAEVATLILDNAGHEERQRARGTSSKQDLNEVVVAVKVAERFDRVTTGRLRLAVTHSRFPDVQQRLDVAIGGGSYGPLASAEPTAPKLSKQFREKALAVLRERAGDPLGTDRLTEAVRDRGVTAGRLTEARQAIKAWAAEPESAIYEVPNRGYAASSGAWNDAGENSATSRAPDVTGRGTAGTGGKPHGEAESSPVPTSGRTRTQGAKAAPRPESASLEADGGSAAGQHERESA